MSRMFTTNLIWTEFHQHYLKLQQQKCSCSEPEQEQTNCSLWCQTTLINVPPAGWLCLCVHTVIITLYKCLLKNFHHMGNVTSLNMCPGKENKTKQKSLPVFPNDYVRPSSSFTKGKVRAFELQARQDDISDLDQRIPLESALFGSILLWW